MITKIFKNAKDYKTYLITTNEDINGCTQEFLDEHQITLVEYSKQNESNSRCWNCWNCNNCLDCFEIENQKDFKRIIPISDTGYSFTYKDIATFTFRDNKYYAEDWTDMFKRVIGELYKINSDIIKKEIKGDEKNPFLVDESAKKKLIANNNHYKGHINPIDGTDKSFYLFTYTNTNTKVEQLRTLLEKYKGIDNKINQNSLSFTLLCYGNKFSNAIDELAGMIDGLTEDKKEEAKYETENMLNNYKKYKDFQEKYDYKLLGEKLLKAENDKGKKELLDSVFPHVNVKDKGQDEYKFTFIYDGKEIKSFADELIKNEGLGVDSPEAFKLLINESAPNQWYLYKESRKNKPGRGKGKAKWNKYGEDNLKKAFEYGENFIKDIIDIAENIYKIDNKEAPIYIDFIELENNLSDLSKHKKNIFQKDSEGSKNNNNLLSWIYTYYYYLFPETIDWSHHKSWINNRKTFLNKLKIKGFNSEITRGIIVKAMAKRIAIERNEDPLYIMNCIEKLIFDKSQIDEKNNKEYTEIKEDKTAEISEEPSQENQNENNKKEEYNLAPEIGKPRNRIVFGAPGTGKSYRLEQDRKDVKDADGKVIEKRFDKDDLYERVTFHPNYSYSNFVGTYKPVSDGNNIKYEYVPGPFLRILIKALKNKNENYLLLIEEINRANVAAVFGDVFQLLDRKDNSSEYPIDLSEDIKNYLKGNIPLENDKLYIPSNMYIWATMNSADQGVFPMDTAFKRRWDFEYIGIDEEVEADVEIDKGKIKKLSDLEIPIPYKEEKENNATWRFIKWNDLRRCINEQLISSKINEDKLLGPFFLSKKNLVKGYYLAEVIKYLNNINENIEKKDWSTSYNIIKTLLNNVNDNDIFKEVYDDINIKEISPNNIIEHIVINVKNFLEGEKGNNEVAKDIFEIINNNRKILDNIIKNAYKFIKLFESKVIMYLFEDVMKIHRDKIFNEEVIGKNNIIFSKICETFEKDGIKVFNFDKVDFNKVGFEKIKELYNQKVK